MTSAAESELPPSTRSRLEERFAFVYLNRPDDRFAFPDDRIEPNGGFQISVGAVERDERVSRGVRFDPHRSSEAGLRQDGLQTLRGLTLVAREPHFRLLARVPVSMSIVSCFSSDVRCIRVVTDACTYPASTSAALRDPHDLFFEQIVHHGARPRAFDIVKRCWDSMKPYASTVVRGPGRIS